MYSTVSAVLCGVALLVAGLYVPEAVAATYYSPQTNFAEDRVPAATYSWDKQNVRTCIYKDSDVPNSYYVWTKLAVQKWRQALREYTENEDQWSFTAKYVKTMGEVEACDVKVYIFASYKYFKDYPAQTGAYTSAAQQDGDLDVRIYLSPFILHGDGKTEIDLPSHAFRNSAIHELGHAFGLGHMKSEKGYLMSPQFDFLEQKQEYPITTLELQALVKIYGKDGFQR